MSDFQSLFDAALQASNQALTFDKTGKQETKAAYFYRVAADLLERAVEFIPDTTQAESCIEKAKSYRNRAIKLEALYDNRNSSTSQSADEKLLSKCYFLFDQALRKDEAQNIEKALELYIEAISLGRQIKLENESIQNKVKALIAQGFERIDELDKRRKEIVDESLDQINNDVTNISLQSTSQNQRHTLHRGSSAHLKVSGEHSYSDEEKRVLLLTSEINEITYVPFMLTDLGEKFKYQLPFTDKDRKLELSPKQKRNFVAWVRPDEICSDPKLISGQFADCFSIKQTVISDCSFVASLAVSALYEKRFNRPLITPIIYPRDSKNRPIYNPFGKYMIKLHLNGVPRKVIIDDYLPVGRNNQLLCSYSSKKNEFWVSLLEKAYMKVMGGYDFPGSNSNIDLHALTGWIPERTAIRTQDPTFNRDLLFDTLLQRMAKGHVLITVATGEIANVEEERTGLVSTHAYAVLDVKFVKGVQLFLLKNPWSHVRWKGNYSELDRLHWTDEIKAELSYDPYSATEFDNGVFWIDYASICNFFDVFYLSWNPEMFQYTYCIHQSWNTGVGPVKDAYNIGDNPQFSLETEHASGAVWILLTRHITQIEDFKVNREYITVLVYKHGGKRVYYPNDPPPYIDGVRINSPHYLCKIKHGPTNPSKYTLVISQYEKMNTIYYTLRAYSTGPFKLKEIKNPYTVVQEISDGKWDTRTAGGCMNHLTYKNNPRYRLEFQGNNTNNKMYIDLKGPREYQVGIDVTIKKIYDESITAPFTTKSTQTFRSGFVYMELENVPSGHLEIVPSTFLPNQQGPFILKIKSTSPFTYTRVQ